jgi:Rps23 Pro-64 3,4-dihydroxylase Tpa1-like proline 4-hydroxylase
MNKEVIEHIAIYHNVFPEGYCEHLISEFDRLENNGLSVSRQAGENASNHQKNDHQIFITLRNHLIQDFENKSCEKLFFTGLQQCYDDYTSKYSLLRSNGNLRATHMKMQRTGPGGGYHVWHCEQGAEHNQGRAVTYMLYLNNITPGDGGETEFLYQKKRILPTANTIILWPASYTHVHRGNTVLGNDSKYIVTGWFSYD